MSNVRVVSDVVTSRILAAEGEDARRRVSMLLPEDHATSGRAYPVLYLLHGAWGSQWADDRLWFGGAYRGSGVRYDLELQAGRAWRSGTAQPFIVVAPDMNRRPPRMPVARFFPAAAAHLAEEVVPFVDDRCRTVRRRDGRGIAGHSDGGTAALAVALLRPDVFGFAASLDGFGSISEDGVRRAVTAHDARRFPVATWLLGMTGGNGIADGPGRAARRALEAIGPPPAVAEHEGDHYEIGPGLDELVGVFSRWFGGESRRASAG